MITNFERFALFESEGGRSEEITWRQFRKMLPKFYNAEDVTPFFRMAMYTGDCLYMDPSKHEREALGILWTDLLDTLPSWSNMPKRKKSVMMGLGGEDEENNWYELAPYRYFVYPITNAPIAIAPVTDLNMEDFTDDDIVLAGNPISGHAFIEFFRDVENCGNHIDGQEKFEEIVDDMERFTAIVRADKKLWNSAYRSYLDYPDVMDGVIEEIKSGKTLTQIVSDALAPEKTGYRTMTASEIVRNSPNSTDFPLECWTEGPCLLAFPEKFAGY